MNINDWKVEKKDSLFEAIIAHLRKRCAEDVGLLLDSEGKTWENCAKYITGKAKEQAVNNCAVVKDEDVYEWAEDYVRMTDEEYKEQFEKKQASAPKATVKKVETPKKKEPDIRVVEAPTFEQQSMF